jgi:hypothetical protein
VRRVGARFALYALAGELLIDYGIVPWSKGDGAAAAAEMFKAWRNDRGTDANHESQQNVEKLRDYVELYGLGRFVSMKDVDYFSGGEDEDDDNTSFDPTLQAHSGWKDNDFYYFHNKGMHDALQLWKNDFKRAISDFVTDGLLKAEPGKNQVRITPPNGHKQQWVYAVRRDALHAS